MTVFQAEKLAGGSMKYALFLISLILGLGGLSHAQQELVSQQSPNAASTTKFWNIENKVNFQFVPPNSSPMRSPRSVHWIKEWGGPTH
jgi:hypothetical protein